MATSDWPDRILFSNDKLVDPAQPDVMLNACVGPQMPRGQGAWTYYTEGFHLAARTLADQLVSQPRHEFPVDVIVYPVFYLYRHHFELLLKSIIWRSEGLLGRPQSELHGHKLIRLWQEARRAMEAALNDADWSQNPEAERLIIEMDALDPDGQRGRYPWSRDGSRSFGTTSLINVRHFADVADRLSHYLQQVDDGLQIYLDQLQSYA